MENDKARIYRSSESDEIYSNLRKNDGPLKGIWSSEIYVLAMALGFAEGKKTPIEGGSSQVSKPDDFCDSLIPLTNAISVFENEGEIEILKRSNSEIFKISDEYANTGITILEEKYFGNENNFILDLHNEIIDIFEQKNILEKIKKLE